jgi:ABC-type bacteriocin/lantibiotic exporter with double-glycine peptidase domain
MFLYYTRLMKLSVPYYSQFVDVADPFWMLRACGACCLKMVAEYHGKDVPDIITLCNEAHERGGYDMINGWVHDYLVMKARELGLQAHRKEGMENLDEMFSSLDSDNPVIVSIEKRVLEQKRFHMVVVVGYEDGDIVYHESESTDKEKGQYRKCSQEVFMEYFRGKAIFFTK